MDEAEPSVRARCLDIDPAARKRLHPARGVSLSVLIGLTFWVGFFTCAYVCLPRSNAQTSTAQLEAVNRDVNARMHYSRFTIGSFHGLVGSCIAYAVNKRDALIKAGWNPERLTIWGVLDNHGERHAVLVVDDDKVLDMGARPWRSFVVDLDYVKRQGYRFLHPLKIGEAD